MKTPKQARDIDGKQGGSLGPLQRIFIPASIVILALPFSAFAISDTKVKSIAEQRADKIAVSYGQMIDIAALLHDYDAKMITAVIVVESEGNSVAVSHKGARGLMQLMPQTAKAMGAKDSHDPFQNILAGTKYLKQLENRYGFSDTKDALVAYNMGPSRAKRWLSQYDSSEYGYVKKVMYVYDTLVKNELENKRIAKAVQIKINEQDSAENTYRPIMTKPRNLSLAQLPMTLPSSRRNELVSDN